MHGRPASPPGGQHEEHHPPSSEGSLPKPLPPPDLLGFALSDVPKALRAAGMEDAPMVWRVTSSAFGIVGHDLASKGGARPSTTRA
jgi:hypothetical protein